MRNEHRTEQPREPWCADETERQAAARPLREAVRAYEQLSDCVPESVPTGFLLHLAGPPGSWNSVNGARAKLVTLSFVIRRLSLCDAMPMRRRSPAAIRSGSL